MLQHMVKDFNFFRYFFLIFQGGDKGAETITWNETGNVDDTG